MQGLSDGYFVLPNTISNYLGRLAQQADPRHLARGVRRAPRPRPAIASSGYMAIGGTHGPDHFHRELGKIIWDYCGMDRTATGLEKALSEIPALHEEFKKDLKVTGSDTSVNQTLEKAGRVDDFFELGMLMCRDALNREESCGGHFRSEHQTDENEALRDDDELRLRQRLGMDGRPARSDREQGTAELRGHRTRHEELQVTALTNLTLKIWRQDGPDEQGRFESHQIPEISDEASFLELLDILNERLIEEGKEAIVFDHDCREGICGTCSLMIDGQAHGPQRGTATCQLHMRVFRAATRSSSSRGGPRRSRSSRT